MPEVPDSLHSSGSSSSSGSGGGSDGLGISGGGAARQRKAIIHYDLKPANILFDEFGDAKITGKRRGHPTLLYCPLHDADDDEQICVSCPFVPCYMIYV